MLHSQEMRLHSALQERCKSSEVSLMLLWGVCRCLQSVVILQRVTHVCSILSCYCTTSDRDTHLSCRNQFSHRSSYLTLPHQSLINSPAPYQRFSCVNQSFWAFVLSLLHLHSLPAHFELIYDFSALIILMNSFIVSFFCILLFYHTNDRVLEYGATVGDGLLSFWSKLELSRLTSKGHQFGFCIWNRKTSFVLWL